MYSIISNNAPLYRCLRKLLIQIPLSRCRRPFARESRTSKGIGSPTCAVLVAMIFGLPLTQNCANQLGPPNAWSRAGVVCCEDNMKIAAATVDAAEMFTCDATRHRRE